jgi:hypothetical protein
VGTGRPGEVEAGGVGVGGGGGAGAGGLCAIATGDRRDIASVSPTKKRMWRFTDACRESETSSAQEV